MVEWGMIDYLSRFIRRAEQMTAQGRATEPRLPTMSEPERARLQTHENYFRVIAKSDREFITKAKVDDFTRVQLEARNAMIAIRSHEDSFENFNDKTELHEKAELRWGNRVLQIDIPLIPLMREVWAAGLDTWGCCQERPAQGRWGSLSGMAWIAFFTPADAEVFVDVLRGAGLECIVWVCGPDGRKYRSSDEARRADLNGGSVMTIAGGLKVQFRQTIMTYFHGADAELAAQAVRAYNANSAKPDHPR
jgi:hypothetical protein